MQTVTCPHCDTTLRYVPAEGAQTCGACGGQFAMPVLPPEPALLTTSVHLAAEPPAWQPQYQQPPMVIYAGPRERRLEAGGWFSRALTSTLGILLAVLLFVAVIVGVPLVLLCSGLMYGGNAIQEEREALSARARSLGRERLHQVGISEVSSDAVAERIGNDVVLIGTASGRDGRLHELRVKFRVGQFGESERWEVLNIVVDGEVEFSAE